MALGKIFGQFSLRALGRQFLKRFGSTVKRRFLRQHFQRRFARFEHLEDRSLMAVTATLLTGTLTVQLDAVSDTATISGNSTTQGGIEVQGTGLAQPMSFAGVNQLVVQDAGTNATQSVTFSNLGGNSRLNIAGALTVAGVETVNFSNNRTINAESISIAATTGGTIIFDANVTSTTITTTGSQTFANPVTLRHDVGLLAGSTGVSLTDVNLGPNTLTITGPGTITGAITGSGGLTKAGAGTLTYSGTAANTNTGLTTVSGGQLDLNKTNVQATGGDIAVTGGTLRMLASNQLSANSNVTVTAGAIDFNTISLTETLGTLTIGGGTVLGGNANITVAGSLLQSAGTHSATTNTLSVAGDWLKTGGTFNHNNGTVVFAGGGLQSLRSGGAAFNVVSHPTSGTLRLLDGLTTIGTFTTSAGVFDINGFTPILNTFVLAGGTVISSTGGGSVLSANPFDVQAGTISAVLAGPVGLNKTTAGTVTLSGVNTFTGLTTVTGGTLAINGSVTSNVTVSSPGILSGTGTVFGNVTGNGTFSPGNGGPGVMRITGNFVPTGTLEFEVNSPYLSAGIDYDQYVVDGNVNLSGALVTFVNNTDTTPPSNNTLLTLISKTSTGPVLPSINPPDGSEIEIGSRLFRILYNGGDGNNVVLQAITPQVSVFVSPSSVPEFGGTNLVYTFTRDIDTGTVPISFSVTGTATLGTDYTVSSPDSGFTFSATSGTIAFADGNTTATVIVDPRPDSLVEMNETITLTVIPGAVYQVADPPNNAATGTITDNTITGVKYNDRNGDGIRNFGEEGVQGVYIFIDVNNDGLLSVLEPAAVTDFFGQYSFPNLPAGVYTIREIGSGFQTQPGTADGAYHVIVPDGPLANLDFGNDMRTANDFGDAPATFGSASHTIVAGVRLGALQDGEPFSLSSATATGDDFTNIDDEDGVIIGNLTPGQGFNGVPQATITVTVGNVANLTARLQGWIDFNQSGTFEASEKVISNRTLGAGTHAIGISIPANARLNPTFARFRYAFEADVGPTGHSNAGEVEDYQVNILPPFPQANDDEFGLPPDLIRQGTTNNELDVLANDQVGAAGPPLIVESDFPLTTAQGGTVSVGAFDPALGRKVLLYTPPSGAVIQAPFDDTFTYRVSSNGTALVPTDSATVLIHVALADPIAVDDTFTLDPPDSGATLATLPVLENDLFPAVNTQVQSVFNITAAPQTTMAINAGDPTKVDFSAPEGFRGTEIYLYTITDSDPATGDSSAFITVQVVEGGIAVTTTELANDYLAQLSIRLLDTSLNPITEINVGETFVIQVRSLDLRPGGDANTRGVEAAYLDLLTPFLITPDGAKLPYATPVSIEYNPRYADANHEIFNSPAPGQVDEAGGFHGFGPGVPPGLEFPVFNLTMLARQSTMGEPGGVIQFRGDSPDGFEANREISDILIRAEVDGADAEVAFHEFNNPPAAPQVLDTFFRPSADFRIIGPEGEFVNLVNPLDVDLDNEVTAGDALLVINSLNSYGPMSLDGVSGMGKVDCDQDNYLTASDALAVINYINSRRSITWVPTSSSSTSDEDTSGADLSGADSSPSTSTSTSTSTVDPVSADELYALDAAREDLWSKYKRR